MKSQLIDKVVLVTGSSRGIGKQTAALLLGLGARVILNGRDPVKLEQTRAELSRLCGKEGQLAAYPADTSKHEEARALLKYINDRFGKLDALINNAGQSMRGAFEDLSEKTLDSILDSNIRTAVYSTQAALPLLLQSKGTVLFVSSLAGVRGFPGVSIYSAAKIALTALSQSIQAEHGHQGLLSGVVYLSFTSNDPDKTILDAQGQEFNHQRKAQLTQDQAAQAVVRSLVHRSRRRYTTLAGKILAWVQGWFPGFTDWVVERSAGKIHRVGK